MSGRGMVPFIPSLIYFARRVSMSVLHTTRAVTSSGVHWKNTFCGNVLRFINNVEPQLDL